MDIVPLADTLGIGVFELVCVVVSVSDCDELLDRVIELLTDGEGNKVILTDNDVDSDADADELFVCVSETDTVATMLAVGDVGGVEELTDILTDELAALLPDADELAVVLTDADELAVLLPDADELAVVLTDADELAVLLPDADELSDLLPDVDKVVVALSDADELSDLLPDVDKVVVALSDADELGAVLPDADKLAVPDSVSLTDTVGWLVTLKLDV